MYKWVCQYCNKQYSNEKRFFSHGPKCPTKQRIDSCKTLVGSIAFSAYNYWMKKTRKGEQTIETFIKSRFFTSCIRFGEFYLQTSVGSMEKYIDFMIKKNYDFPMWSSGIVFAEYMFHYDSIHAPIEQWNLTFDIIEQYCIDYKCEPKDVFKHLEFEEVFSLVRRKKLSNWYLLLSAGFRDWISSVPEDYRSKIMEVMRPEV